MEAKQPRQDQDPSAGDPDADDGGRGEGLQGATVLAFESRRAEELGSLIGRHGGVPVVEPAMREVPVEDNAPALDLLRRLEQGEVDTVVLLTGVGVRTLAQVGAAALTQERFAELLGGATLVARGPKPVAELRKLGLSPEVRVPEPNTWRELLEELDAGAPVRGRCVAVLEYGESNAELLDGLEERGAEVDSVRVYRWAMPEDLGPLREAVSRLARADADYVLFTNGAQVDHVMQVAVELGLREAVIEAAGKLTVASIGPICSEALRRHGLPIHVEPEHPKMGHLVATLAGRRIGSAGNGPAASG